MIVQTVSGAAVHQIQKQYTESQKTSVICIPETNALSPLMIIFEANNGAETNAILVVLTSHFFFFPPSDLPFSLDMESFQQQ